MDTHGSTFDTEFGSQDDAAERLHHAGAQAADVLADEAANATREGADTLKQGKQKAEEVAHRVKGRLKDGVQYIRSNSADDMLESVENMTRKHPTRTLLAVAVVGFVAGRMMRSDR